ncbi:VOC family protein [uncultured Oscillibacter sp.]|uniref:VOC family protein n=1 Tax=uncultured Oscillibacter sp. TaxID=876091 RepID=UPI0025EA1F84|nr:VOC family protein [uncultured Oscillibacter sp.]
MKKEEWVREIFQVVCVVEDLEKTLENWKRLVEFDQSSIHLSEDAGTGRLGERTASRCARFDLGGVQIRLVEPLDKGGPDPYAAALRRSGPGFHHLGLSVRSRDELTERYEAMGLFPIFKEETEAGPAPLYELDSRLGMSFVPWDRAFGPCARLAREERKGEE